VPAAGPSNQKVTFFAFLDVSSLRVKMSEVFLEIFTLDNGYFP